MVQNNYTAELRYHNKWLLDFTHELDELGLWRDQMLISVFTWAVLPKSTKVNFSKKSTKVNQKLTF